MKLLKFGIGLIELRIKMLGEGSEVVLGGSLSLFLVASSYAKRPVYILRTSLRQAFARPHVYKDSERYVGVY